MTDADMLAELERLGARRSKINADRARVLAELRELIREASGAGLRPSAIARSAGISREAVRLALQN